jgi:hypothetical protein
MEAKKSLKTHKNKYYNKYLSFIKIIIMNSINCVKQRRILNVFTVIGIMAKGQSK